MRNELLTLTALLPLSAVALVVGCKTAPDAPKHAEITQEITAEAKVLAVDASTRAITLESEDGAEFVIVAGPEIRNFDQIAAGNTVSARYVEALSVRLLEADETPAEPTISVIADRANEGDNPAAALASGIVMTVTVESVDVAENLVVFTNPLGELRVVRAEREEGQEFIAGLKPGDRVEIRYGQALALAVN